MITEYVSHTVASWFESTSRWYKYILVDCMTRYSDVVNAKITPPTIEAQSQAWSSFVILRPRPVTVDQLLVYKLLAIVECGNPLVQTNRR